METNTKSKKAWYKKWWVWLIAIFLVIGIAGASGDKDKSSITKSNSESATNQTSEPKTEESKKLSLQETYDKVSNGMAKAEVEAIVGKDTGTCTVTEDPMIGKMEACTYGSAVNNIFDGGMIMITYQNDQVYNKTISKF